MDVSIFIWISFLKYSSANLKYHTEIKVSIEYIIFAQIIIMCSYFAKSHTLLGMTVLSEIVTSPSVTDRSRPTFDLNLALFINKTEFKECCMFLKIFFNIYHHFKIYLVMKILQKIVRIWYQTNYGKVQILLLSRDGQSGIADNFIIHYQGHFNTHYQWCAARNLLSYDCAFVCSVLNWHQVL